MDKYVVQRMVGEGSFGKVRFIKLPVVELRLCRVQPLCLRVLFTYVASLGHKSSSGSLADAEGRRCSSASVNACAPAQELAGLS